MQRRDLNTGDFYLNERMKVGGKTNNMGKEASLAREKNKIFLCPVLKVLDE